MWLQHLSNCRHLWPPNLEYLKVVGQIVVDGINPVALRDVETGSVLQQLTGHEYSVQSAAFSPQGHLIATAGRYQDVLIHSLDGTLLHRLTTGSRNESLAFSSDGPYLLAVIRLPDPTHPGRNEQRIRGFGRARPTGTMAVCRRFGIGCILRIVQ